MTLKSDIEKELASSGNLGFKMERDLELIEQLRIIKLRDAEWEKAINEFVQKDYYLMIVKERFIDFISKIKEGEKHDA